MIETTSKKTALYDVHKALGAKLIPFAGYDMPVRYTGDKEEHLVVRQKAGIFDVSHMGEFIIRGEGALQLIQHVTSNDASKLFPGRAQYSCIPNREGGIVDDCIVYHIRDDEYMIVANASNIEKDWNWITAANTFGAECIDISEKTSLLAVSGPNADAIVSQLTDMPVEEMGTYYCMKGVFNGVEDCMVATTGYTGERTYEIFFRNEHANEMWDAIMKAGEPHGLQPTGLGARDTLRLEMGYMLYGNDINDETSPIEAGLSWITKLKKGEFIGSDKISAVKADGAKRKLVGFKMIDKGIPRAGYELAKDGNTIGTITSGSISPLLGIGIGMGYVPAELAEPGTKIDVLVRNKSLSAEIVKTPFIEK